ncbi:MAG: hypothetical protein EPO28_02630 [Saprospiraceae bacterium]|nr:MAG: hypothetical protein EPO28_02630 [Saprospiraceae bacterium]
MPASLIKLNYKVIALVCVLALLGFIAAYAAEFRVFANTLDAQDLIVKSLIGGLATGVLLSWQLKKYTEDILGKMRLWTGCICMCTLFAPLIGSWANRLPAYRSIHEIQVEFFSEKPYAASRFGYLEGEKIEPDGYYIFIFKDGKLERLRSESPKFPEVERGDKVRLNVQKGIFGYEVVRWK